MMYYQEVMEYLESKGWDPNPILVKLANEKTQRSELPELTLWDRITNVPWRIWYEVFSYRLFNPRWYKRIWIRIRYGFNPSDSWNLDHSLAVWIIPRLKHLRGNLNGFPGSVIEDTEDPVDDEDALLQRWQEILDEILWAFEFYVDEYSTYAGEKQWNRWKEAMNLFTKYYANLWD